MPNLCGICFSTRIREREERLLLHSRMSSRTDVKSTSCDDRGRASQLRSIQQNTRVEYYYTIRIVPGITLYVFLAVMHDIAISHLQQLRPVSGHLYGDTVL